MIEGQAGGSAWALADLYPLAGSFMVAAALCLNAYSGLAFAPKAGALCGIVTRGPDWYRVSPK